MYSTSFKTRSLRNGLVLVLLCSSGLLCVSCQQQQGVTIIKEPESAAAEKPDEPRKSVSDGALEIFTVPRNGGFLRNLEKPLIVGFSHQIRSKDFSFNVIPDAGDWQARWNLDSTRVVLTHTDPLIKSVAYTLTLEHEPDQESKEIRFTASGPSSLELIEEAEIAGLLDRDTAWKYRFQGLLGSSELPNAYQSLAPLGCTTSFWKRFKQIRAELKPETLAELQPYLVRPDHPDSIFSQILSTGDAVPAQSELTENLHQYKEKVERPKNMWSYIDCSDKLRVWYHLGWEAKANRACELLNQKRMYRRFQELLGREPLSDDTICADEADEKLLQECLQEQGGDGRLDIYLVYPWEVDKDWSSGWCRDIVLEGQISPTFILVDASLEETPKNYFGGALAHELFHSFQSAFDAWEDNWWVEGTAVWAEHFIEGSWDTEQDYLKDAFSNEESRLLTLTSDKGMHDYGIYIFPFHLSQQQGDSIVTDIWRACAREGVNNATAYTGRYMRACLRTRGCQCFAGG